MQQIILRLFEICSFRAGPQDLPASSWLLRLVLVAYVVLEIVSGAAFGLVKLVLAEALFGLIVLAASLYVGLQWQNKRERFLQSFLALLGSGVVIGTLSLPLLFAMSNAEKAGEPVVNLLIIALLFLVWQVTVFAHIIKHTFEIHIGYALVVTVIYIVVYKQVASVVFPVET